MRPLGCQASTGYGSISADLPFLVNGTLSPAEAARVHEHLQACEHCRRDLELERALLACVREQPVVDYAPHAAFAKLSVRIDDHEARRARLGWWRIPARVRLRLRDAVILTQAAAIMVLAILLADSGWREPPAAAYRTLTRPDTAVRPDAALLRVVFDDGVRSAELRRMLDTAGATVVDGPSPNGVFTIALVATPTGIVDEPAAVAGWLRAQSGVRFAEVVRPVPSER